MNTTTITTGIIDVAHWDADDHRDLEGDLARAVAAGVVAVVAKATQGRDGMDRAWPRWVEACRAAGVLFGAYHFASNTEPGENQAEWFLAHVRAAGLDPATTLLALDFERNPDRSKTMTLEQARAFAQRIHDKVGRWPLLYGDQSFLSQITDPHDVLCACPLWEAVYGGAGPKVPPGWATRGWTLRQYSDGHYSASIGPRETPGFPRMDRSAFRGTVEQLRAAWPALGG